MRVGEPYYVTQTTGNKCRKVLKQDSIVYIPIADTLRSLLQRSDLQKAIFNSSQVHSESELRDMCDGTIFKNHPVLSHNPKALQLIAYF